MKKTIKNLSLLACMSFLLVSCNEKISAELESGNSTTLPPVITPSNYYFRVVNDSSVLLNYSLHKTGPGLFGTNGWECTVSTTTKFDDQLFSAEGSPLANIPHDNKVYDISCFLEGQEQDLFFNGASLKVEAGPNTCEYVSYAPFSYFERMPGKTTANFSGVVCNDATITSGHVATFPSVPTYNGGIKIGCNQMVDTNTPEPLRQPRTITDDAQILCRFDYQEVNCDSGTIGFDIQEVYDAREEETDPVSPAIKSIPRSPHSCGGSTAACVGGPLRQHSELSDATRGAIVTKLTPNQKFERSYEIEAPNQLGPHVMDNFYISNFRKSLANRHLNFIDHNDLTTFNWYDVSNGRSYDPRIMENYAANMAPNGQRIVSSLSSHTGTALIPYSEWETFAYQLGYKTEPLAAEPFVGLGARINPFHTFYCLDEGKETKARIRIAVRDWDRIFPSNKALFEEISDTYQTGASRRMDVAKDGSEIPGDPGYYMGYNDYDDWDDKIPMVRTNQFPYAPGVIWQPEFTGPDTTGFFKLGNFPK